MIVCTFIWLCSDGAPHKYLIVNKSVTSPNCHSRAGLNFFFCDVAKLVHP